MRSVLRTVAAAILPLALAVPAAAQCPGQGNLTLQITTIDNGPSLAGKTVVIRIEGPPEAHVCLACDPLLGPTLIPGFPDICIGFSPNFQAIMFQLPPSGVVQFEATLPDEGMPEVCCLAVGFENGAPRGVAISNAICLDLEEPCVSGGHSEVSYTTTFSNPGTAPHNVSARLGGQQGQPLGQTDVVYDPNNPPTFPISDDGIVTIENIALVGGGLQVSVFNSSANLTGSKPEGRLPNESTFTVHVDGDTNSARVHTSCSQPLSAGMMFGPLTITHVRGAKEGQENGGAKSAKQPKGLAKGKSK